MSAAIDQVLRFGSAIVLAVTVACLLLATRRTSKEIGGRAYAYAYAYA
ncbi:hypothetical protein [Aureimonas sp. N4]|nr:hypothetical protein [Aureimonas sp. N4]